MNPIHRAYMNHMLHPFQAWDRLKYHATMSARFEELLIGGAYKWMSDRLKPNTTILDIGAYVLDTALYFSLFKEVRSVLAFEPDNHAFDIASKHLQAIKTASDGRKIKLVHAAVGKDYVMSGQNISDHQGVKTLSLNEIIPTKNVAIKCDCEGGEYEIFTKESDLANVYLIQIEYHMGQQKIPDILRSKGFKVKVGKPRMDNIGRITKLGYIYASR